MSGRQVRKVLFFAIVVGVGYWIYTAKPTFSGIVDSITSPLFGSRAAVKSSEHNRVEGDAINVVAEQSDSRVTMLHEGMSRDEIRDLLGKPDAIENSKTDGIEEVRWTYRDARRVIVFRNNRVVSISVL